MEVGNRAICVTIRTPVNVLRGIEDSDHEGCPEGLLGQFAFAEMA